MSLVSVVFYQAQVSASGRSLVQGSPTECVVSECDHEASVLRRPRPRPTKVCGVMAALGLESGLIC